MNPPAQHLRKFNFHDFTQQVLPNTFKYVIHPIKRIKINYGTLILILKRICRQDRPLLCVWAERAQKLTSCTHSPFHTHSIHSLPLPHAHDVLHETSTHLTHLTHHLSLPTSPPTPRAPAAQGLVVATVGWPASHLATCTSAANMCSAQRGSPPWVGEGSCSSALSLQ